MSSRPGRDARYAARSRAPRAVSRFELPEIDAAAFEAARWTEQALSIVREAQLERWIGLLAPLPDRLRDAEPAELMRTATQARSLFGVKDSLGEVLPDDVSLALRDAIDRLRRELARYEAHAGRS